MYDVRNGRKRVFLHILCQTLYILCQTLLVKIYLWNTKLKLSECEIELCLLPLDS